MRLIEKVAVVTGAAGGFGEAVVRRFVEEGATVVAVDMKSGGWSDASVYPFSADVTSEADWNSLVNFAVGKFGKIDVLVNNAGIITYETVFDQDLDLWGKMIAVNQTGVMLGMKSVLPGMIERGRGSVVNVASTLGVVAVNGAFAYHATKAAVLGMTKNAAITYAKKGVRVNAVLPGISDTGMVRRQPEDFTAAGVAAHPMGRLTKPEEIANGILFLASDESSAVTGIGLPVDGGYLAQ